NSVIRSNIQPFVRVTPRRFNRQRAAIVEKKLNFQSIKGLHSPWPAPILIANLAGSLTYKSCHKRWSWNGVVRGQCEIFKAMDCEEFTVCFAVLRDAA